MAGVGRASFCCCCARFVGLLNMLSGTCFLARKAPAPVARSTVWPLLPASERRQTSISHYSAPDIQPASA
jgi:hypothetical protein